MAYFASTDITVTVAAKDRNIFGAAGQKNGTIATVAFGDASLQYATDGVPMPAIGTFGYHKEIALGLIQQPSANGFLYKYDSTNRKIKIFTQGIKTGATAAGAPENGALVKNSLGVQGTPRMPNTVASTTYDMGEPIELPNGTAIAAVSIKLLLIGE